MKDYFDFTNYEKNLRVYGGESGRKLGIIFNGTNYLLKFPGSIELKNIKNILSPYSNSPITEYIGSHIYEILNIPVHETLLGKFSGPKEHIVVACKDFNKTKEDRFLSFGEIKTTFIPHFTDSNGNDTNGNGTDLHEILLTLEQHPIFEFFRDKIKERFWQMFIIDCLIGNSDRNNGNWGIIQHYDDSFSIAPVFDNGSCLHNTWDENKIKLCSNKELDSFIDNQTCVFLNKNKKLNPTKFIQEYKNDDCTNVFISLYPKIEKNIGLINNFIEELPDEILNIPCVSKIKKEFYKSLINKKFERSFTKIYSELTSKNHIFSSQEQRSNKMSELKYTKNQDIVFHGTDNPLIIPEGTVLPLGVTPTHCYVFKDGTICKSVTQVLENQEFADNFSQLSGNAKIIADEAAQFGTLVHNTVEKYLKSCEQGHYTFNKDKDYQKLQNIIKELIPELYNEYRIRHTPKGSLEKIADKTGKEMTWGESISDHATFILQKIDSLNLKYAYPEQILALRQPMPV